MRWSAGYGNLLDTDALEGLLDPELMLTNRKSRRNGGSGASITETHNMFGSLMDTGDDLHATAFAQNIYGIVNRRNVA